MTLTVERNPIDKVLAAWRDPEFWPPPGLGCSHCHAGIPIVMALDFGALCERCLMAAFPVWDWERMERWLVRQWEMRAAMEARKVEEARQMHMDEAEQARALVGGEQGQA